MRSTVNVVETAAAPPGFRFGAWDILRGRPRKGSGGSTPPPRCQRNLKICKIFLKKIANNALFQAIFKKFKNPALNFRAFGRKTQLFVKLLKLFENFQNLPKKIEKMHYLSLFFNNFKTCVNFSCVWTINTNCWEILRKF